MNENKKIKIVFLTLFGITMGLLETAVVVYLRKLYYAGGFKFPLNTINDYTVSITEILREASTIIMLVSVAYLYGRNFLTRLAAFLFCFAVWDIFYYIFLKMLLDWPPSFFTWDVLFLIPVVWTGPVLAPVIISFTMILFAWVFIRADKLHNGVRLLVSDWWIFSFAALAIFISFTIDSTLFIFENHNFSEISNLNFNELFALLKDYIPQHFRWWIFLVGEAGLLTGVGRVWLRTGLK